MLPLHRTQLSVFNYEEIPAGYYHEVMRGGHPVQKFWHQKKFLSVAHHLPASARVLDLGCGPGSFLDVAAENRPDIRGVGIDIASRQIDFARRNVQVRHGDRVEFLQLKGGEDRLPFEDGSFDVVTSIEVIEHIHPFLALQMLVEARRLLRPGGKLIVTTPNYRSAWPLIEWALEKLSPVKYHEQHINKYTPNSLLKFLECAGYKVGRVSSIFMIAPFLAGASWKFAETVDRAERSSDFLLGSLLIAEAEVDTQIR